VAPGLATIPEDAIHMSGTTHDQHASHTAVGVGRPGRFARLARRLIFPVGLIGALGLGFVLMGPPSKVSSVDALTRIAPGALAADGTYTPRDASELETDIAKLYATLIQAPDTVEAYVGLGNGYVQRAREHADPTDYIRAEAAFAEALRRSPDNVDALIGSGALALARHEFATALRLAERAVALAPERARPYGVLVDAQTELGRYDEAVATAQRMVDLRPDLASYSRVSYQRELHGQIDGALDAMVRAYQAGGSNSENTEYIRTLIGGLYLLGGDLEAAERTFRASLAASPEYVWAMAGLARVHAVRGELDEAIALHERMVEITPLPEFVIALGETQELAGRTEEATRSYALARAIQDVFAANGVDTDLDLALFEADHGEDPAAAVALARRAYEGQPNVKAADALGWALYRAGELDEARRYADEALRLDSPYGLFRYHAGVIALAQGDTEAGTELLLSAFELDPYFSPLHAREARAALDGLGVSAPEPTSRLADPSNDASAP
jgi:tetratricopeptide (TPR) repeat protein